MITIMVIGIYIISVFAVFNALSSSEPLAALFQAFREWGVSLSDVSANTNPNNAAENLIL